MMDGILRLIRVILRSLFMLFEGVPALDAVRAWFGADRGSVGGGFLLLVVVLGAATLGLLLFLILLRWLGRKGLVAGEGRLPPRKAPP
ncbi:MAG: hypothetical protein AB1347_05740 [Acidobacteriota bacterium]